MNADTYGIDLKKSVLNKGNLHRLIHVMQNAARGKSITIGFLGGSITQGCLSSTLVACLVHLLTENSHSLHKISCKKCIIMSGISSASRRTMTQIHKIF